MHPRIRFGVEIEIGLAEELLKEGFDAPSHVSRLMALHGLDVEPRPWQYTNNNSCWVCKPDSSCGVEICSPVMSIEDWNGVAPFVNFIRSEKTILIDDKCAFHVHIDVSDFVDSFFRSSEELCSILAWWVKCEHIFMDFAPPHRKKNKYCRCIGLTDYFDHDDTVLPSSIVQKLSDKYLTLNTFHLFNQRRKTIEFRLAESSDDFEFLSNWTRVIFCFLDSSLKSKLPCDYRWVDPKDFFSFLDFGEKELRNWFLARILKNCGSTPVGPWSFSSRKHVFEDYLNIFMS